ncbi:hypothetical protein ES703_25765 [subsurface metagenome]
MISSSSPTRAPPSPQGRCFEFWKLKQPRSPNVPHFFPLHSASQAWQASSITTRLCFLAMALILSIFAGSPRICTGIIALVFLLILSSILSGFIWNVSGSVSTKTGRAAEPMTTLYVAINVYGETMTSSPTPISSTCKAVSRALVPFTVQTQRLAPINSAYFFSNSKTVSPLPLNQFPLRSMDITDFSADLSQTGQEGQGLVLTG